MYLVLKFACACDSLLSVLQLQKSFRSIDTIYSQVFVVSLFLWIVLWKLIVVQGKGLGEKWFVSCNPVILLIPMCHLLCKSAQD
jgi:uncharacterized membrane protein